MPFATAALDARAGRRIVAAGIATALQGVFYWLILREAVQPTQLPISIPLEVTIFQATRRARPATLPPRRQPEVPRRQATPTKQASSVRQPSPLAETAQPITPPRAAEPAPHTPIDWQQAMQSEVRAQESAARTRRLQFGFPRSPPPGPAAPAEFGWYYAATHRMEPLRGGGTIINLTDRCMIVIYVLPIPVCRMGDLPPPNGRLFDHMRDRRYDGPGALP